MPLETPDSYIAAKDEAEKVLDEHSVNDKLLFFLDTGRGLDEDGSIKKIKNNVRSQFGDFPVQKRANDLFLEWKYYANYIAPETKITTDQENDYDKIVDSKNFKENRKKFAEQLKDKLLGELSIINCDELKSDISSSESKVEDFFESIANDPDEILWLDFETNISGFLHSFSKEVAALQVEASAWEIAKHSYTTLKNISDCLNGKENFSKTREKYEKSEADIKKQKPIVDELEDLIYGDTNSSAEHGDKSLQELINERKAVVAEKDNFVTDDHTIKTYVVSEIKLGDEEIKQHVKDLEAKVKSIDEEILRRKERISKLNQLVTDNFGKDEKISDHARVIVKAINKLPKEYKDYDVSVTEKMLTKHKQLLDDFEQNKRDISENISQKTEKLKSHVNQFLQQKRAEIASKMFSNLDYWQNKKLKISQAIAKESKKLNDHTCSDADREDSEQNIKNLKQQLVFINEIIKNAEGDLIEVNRDLIDNFTELSEREKDDAKRSLGLVVKIDKETFEKINKTKNDIKNKQLDAFNGSDKDFVKNVAEILGKIKEGDSRELERALHLMYKCESEYIFSLANNETPNFILKKASYDLLYETIYNNKEKFIAANVSPDVVALGYLKVESGSRSVSSSFYEENIHKEIKRAIGLKREDIKNRKGGLDKEMQDVVNFLKGGVLTRDAKIAINNSRKRGKESIYGKLKEKLPKPSDDDVAAQRKLNSLYKKGEIFNAACYEVCREAEIKMGNNAEGELSKFGKSQGLNKFDRYAQLDKYNIKNAGTISSKMNWKNLFVYEVGFHFGVLTTLFNTIAAFKTGNWDNEYIYAGLATAYASYKEFTGDYIEGWMHPDKLPILLSGHLNKQEAACFTNPAEVKVAKMIDWQKLRKRKNKSDKLMQDDAPDDLDRVIFSKLSDPSKKKKSKDASPGKITIDELDSIADNIPLLNDSGRDQFKLAVGQLNDGDKWASNRWDFYDKILSEPRYSSSDMIDAVAFAATQG